MLKTRDEAKVLCVGETKSSSILRNVLTEPLSGAPVRSNRPSQTSPGTDVPVVAMIAGKAGSSKGVHKM